MKNLLNYMLYTHEICVDVIMAVMTSIKKINKS